MLIDGGDGNVRLAVSGELDLATADEFDPTPPLAQAGARDDRLRIVSGPPAVDRLFSLPGFEHRFELTS